MPLVDLSRPFTRSSLYNDNVATCKLDTAKGNNVLAYGVLRRGELVAERYYQGHDASTHFRQWSVTKTWASVLIGTLVDAGTLSLSATLETIFSDESGSGEGGASLWEQITNAEEKKAITLRELLTMSSGLQDVDNSPQDSLVQVLNAARWKGNKDFEYLATAHVLSYVIRAAAGATPQEYALGNSGVFGALGIGASDFTWTANIAHTAANAEGMHGSAFGLQMTTTGMLKLGQLLLQQGRASETVRVLSAEYAQAAGAVQVGPWFGYGFCGAGDIWTNGYGYQTWTNRATNPEQVDFFCAVGYLGQYVCVYPSLELVVAASSSDDMSSCRLMREVPRVFAAGDDAVQGGCVASTVSSSETEQNGLVIGVAVGAAAVVVPCVAALVVVWWYTRKNRRVKQAQHPDVEQSPAPPRKHPFGTKFDTATGQPIPKFDTATGQMNW